MTSVEVARKAGVSRATVSYVLNGAEHQRISQDTRARVLAIADQLGYRPNAAALALRNGHSDIVLLSLPPWPHGPVIVDAIDAAVAGLRDLGFTPLVHFEQPADAPVLAETCARIQPVGVIAPSDGLPKALVTKLRRNRTRAVVAISDHPLDYVSTVVVHQPAIGRAAVDYLKRGGHRRVLALVPPHSDLATVRLEGARAIKSVKLDVAECDLGGVADAIEARSAGVTAIYAFNDEYAFVALRALVDRGIRVPDDVALIGTDDVALAAVVLPALTTVRIDGAAFGTALANALKTAVARSKPDAVEFLVDPEVVVRQSA